jgi:hypothetical protein
MEEDIMINFICFYYSPVLFIWFLSDLSPETFFYYPSSLRFFNGKWCEQKVDFIHKKEVGAICEAFVLHSSWRIDEAWKSKGL